MEIWSSRCVLHFVIVDWPVSRALSAEWPTKKNWRQKKAEEILTKLKLLAIIPMFHGSPSPPPPIPPPHFYSMVLMHSTAFTAKHLDVNCFVWPARSQNKTGRINLEEKLLNYIVAITHWFLRRVNLYASNVRATAHEHSNKPVGSYFDPFLWYNAFFWSECN